MLKVLGGKGRHCDGITRRSFLQAGVLGLGGLTLPDALKLQAATAAATGQTNRKSVILFWLSGGPGHMETWDPKPDAPRQFRGPFGAIPTALPGTHLCELLPEQAKPLDAHGLRRARLQRRR
jgi:uncharacterized protein (DUF1501 family)